MSKTYTQIHIHAVFAVKYRKALICPSWKNRLYNYMTAILHNRGHRMLQINGVEDHVHMFFGHRPDQSLSALIKMVKGDSARWINQQGLCAQHFPWQSGFGAFSYAKSEIPNVVRYIANQEEHHRKKSLIEEYKETLEWHQVDYDEQYIFQTPSD